MIVYAVALSGVGYITYIVAPEGASAKTAVAITGGLALLTLVCAVLALLIKANRRLGMIGIHVGLLIPLVAIAGSAARLSGSLENAQAGNAAISALVEQLDSADTGTLQKKDDDVWKLAFPGSGVSVELTNVFQPKGYQTVGIASTALLSAFAFVAFLLHRPKLPPKPKVVKVTE